MQYRFFKIRVKSKDESIKLQKKLFQRKIGWGTHNFQVQEEYDIYYIYVNIKSKIMVFSSAPLIDRVPEFPIEFFLGKKMSRNIKRQFINLLKEMIQGKHI